MNVIHTATQTEGVVQQDDCRLPATRKRRKNAPSSSRSTTINIWSKLEIADGFPFEMLDADGSRGAGRGAAPGGRPHRPSPCRGGESRCRGVMRGRQPSGAHRVRYPATRANR